MTDARLSPAEWLESLYDQISAEHDAHGIDRDAHLRTELANATEGEQGQ